MAQEHETMAFGSAKPAVDDSDDRLESPSKAVPVSQEEFVNLQSQVAEIKDLLIKQTLEQRNAPSPH